MPILNMIGVLSLIAGIIMMTVIFKSIVTAVTPTLLKTMQQIPKEVDYRKIKADIFEVQHTLRWRFK
ncbi:hypothetical protein JOC36_000859 [Weissella uvarum]|uniref:hypothetical protein n=1 Tax=Weissella uvarum TaxID=1479233 RepID=UPI00195F66E4|nr:hypothetical protein [Weissella uvarum]MBM7617310.1 hypothetical protein [Weissella uvarum]MCM0595177.1 hypothetical protein [Weissella uvarum]